MQGGGTALHFAAFHGHPNVVRILLEASANVDALNEVYYLHFINRIIDQTLCDVVTSTIWLNMPDLPGMACLQGAHAVLYKRTTYT